MWPEKQELLELMWQKYPEGVFKENTISYAKVEGIQSVQKQASDKKYVPPNIRNFGEDSSSSAAPPAQGPIPGLPPGYTSQKSQQAAKGKANNKPKPANNADSAKKADGQEGSADDDIKKRIINIKRKIKDIGYLKEKAEKGEKIDTNQRNKIAGEAQLKEELAALQLK